MGRIIKKQRTGVSIFFNRNEVRTIHKLLLSNEHDRIYSGMHRDERRIKLRELLEKYLTEGILK